MAGLKPGAHARARKDAGLAAEGPRFDRHSTIDVTSSAATHLNREREAGRQGQRGAEGRFETSACSPSRSKTLSPP